MNDTINLLPLSSFMSTSYHVKELLLALDHLKASYFQKKQSFATTLEQEIPFPLSQSLHDLAKTHNVNLADVVQAEKFFTSLREAIEKMPQMTLTICITPTLGFIKEINRWVTENLKQAVVLDFIVDETIVGGAKIAFKGKIVDYTVKKRLEGLNGSF